MPDSGKKSYLSKRLKRLSSIRIPEVTAWCLRRVPILEWAPKYDLRRCLIPDCVSGIILTFHQVAHGLAFAVMSSVHPMFGLYGSFFPPMIYAIFGMGRHVVTGTFAITSLISAAAVERLVPSVNLSTINGSVNAMGMSDFEMQRIGVATAVTFLGGVIQMSMSFLQLGPTTFLLSEPVVSAMTTGAATHVVTSQVKFLLGMDVPYISGPLGMFKTYMYIFKNIQAVHVAAMLLSLLSLIVLVLTKEMNERFKKKIKLFIPIDTALMVATSLACYFANLNEDHGFKVVGHVPKGIPLPRAPPMDILQDVVVEAFSLALVGYTVSIFLAYNSSRRFKYPISENQELFAHGLSNVVPSFFYCIPNAGAPVRTYLLFGLGAQTQVACLVSSILVLLVIYLATPLLYWLPMCVLASVIVVGLKGMLRQFQDLKKYWKIDKYDWLIWVCTYVVTICFAANIGLLFGVLFNIAVETFRLTRSRAFELHHCDSSALQEEDCAEFNVISVGTPLHFLNAKKFRTDILKQLHRMETEMDSHQCNGNLLLIPASNGSCNGMRSHRDRTTIILNCRGVTFFDFTGVSTLAQVGRDVKERGSDVVFSGCTESLRKSLLFCNCEVNEHYFFKSIRSALDAMKKMHEKENGSSLEAALSSDV